MITGTHRMHWNTFFFSQFLTFLFQIMKNAKKKKAIKCSADIGSPLLYFCTVSSCCFKNRLWLWVFVCLTYAYILSTFLDQQWRLSKQYIVQLLASVFSSSSLDFDGFYLMPCHVYQLFVLLYVLFTCLFIITCMILCHLRKKNGFASFNVMMSITLHY